MRWFIPSAALAFGFLVNAAEPAAHPAGGGQPPVQSSPETRVHEHEPYLEFAPPRATNAFRWSAAFGVGIIGDTTVADYVDFAFDKLSGEGGGLTYNLSIACVLHEFDFRIGRVRLRPQLEAPFMLTLVDDGELDLAPDLNLGLVLRWRDCPWNRYIYTTFAVGGGISWASEVWTGDYQRHEGDEDRSQWKFWLPIEVTLALPRYLQHQIMLFIDHQSGAHVFDKGGIDAWGFGYRFMF